MKQNICKHKLEKVAREIAEKFGNESLDDPESVGFIRFMMYSCLFFHATAQCGSVPCQKCKAGIVIENGLEKHQELYEEYCSWKAIRSKKEQ